MTFYSLKTKIRARLAVIPSHSFSTRFSLSRKRRAPGLLYIINSARQIMVTIVEKIERGVSKTLFQLLRPTWSNSVSNLERVAVPLTRGRVTISVCSTNNARESILRCQSSRYISFSKAEKKIVALVIFLK